MVEIVNGLLLRDRQVLMARRSATRRNYPNTWSFPGGHVKEGEAIEFALTRELSEEIGVVVKSLRLLQSVDVPQADHENPVTFHFFAIDKWESHPSNLGDEHSELRWVHLEDAAKIPDLALASYIDLLGTLSDG